MKGRAELEALTPSTSSDVFQEVSLASCEGERGKGEGKDLFRQPRLVEGRAMEEQEGGDGGG